MDELNVAIDRQSGSQQFNKKFGTFLSLPKFIFLILGIIILVELIYAIRVLALPMPASKTVNRAVIQSGVGKISLIVPNKGYSVNDVVSVGVVVDTGGNIVDGVDLIVRFDPKVLDATPAGLIKGNILDEYPTVSIDKNKGLVAVSGISNIKNGFKGNALFAIINFRAKTTGRTSLSIDFQGKGITTDSNLIETATSKDILEQVGNLELNVQ